MSRSSQKYVTLKLTEEEVAGLVDSLTFARDMMELLAQPIPSKGTDAYDKEGYVERAEIVEIILARLLRQYQASDPDKSVTPTKIDN